VDFCFGDVRELQAMRWVLEQHAVDTIFHLAAQPLVTLSNVVPFDTLSVNALGTYAVLEAARQTPNIKAFIYTSSGTYYGEAGNDAALDETQPPLESGNLYTASVVAAEAAVRGYTKTFELPTLSCRFLNVYGAGDLNFSRLVPRALRNLLMGAPYVFGERDDGRTKLDFIYVNDLVRGLVRAAESLHKQPALRGEVFNLGSGYPVSLGMLARLISRNFDGQEREPGFYGTPRAQALIRYLDISKAARVLQWQPETELQDGLRKTIAWYQHCWQQLW
jgi:nucleoside-diphosphate-sugar epimerase